MTWALFFLFYYGVLVPITLALLLWSIAAGKWDWLIERDVKRRSKDV